MPLLPIDLQTMFSQMSQIGREQAVQKDVPPQYQAVQAEQIVRKSEHDDKAVNQAREAGQKEGAERVSDAGRRRRRRGNPREQRGRQREQPAGRRGGPPARAPASAGPAPAESAATTAEQPKRERREVFEDPALGHNVDLVG